MMKELNIKHIRTSVYAARSNGVIERSHRSLNEILAKLQNKQKNTWDLYVNQALLALRTQVSRTTNKSAYELLYHKSPVLPLDQILIPRRKNYKEDYHAAVFQDMHRAFLEVLRYSHKTKEARNKTANKNRKLTTFEVGDNVFYRNHKRESKLDPKWKENYVITHKNGPLSYIIRNEVTKKQVRAHANSLRHANCKWKIPKLEKPIRKAQMAAVPPTSSESDDTSEESDIFVIPTKNDGVESDDLGVEEQEIRRRHRRFTDGQNDAEEGDIADNEDMDTN